MIDRQWAGLLPAKPHTVLRDASGNLFYEEMHTRHGFGGAFTYLYHRYPVTAHTEVSMTRRGFAAPVADDAGRFPIRRRLYNSDGIAAGGQLLDRRTPVLFNDDVAIYLARPTESDDAYFANGDGDELWFFQEGTAKLESVCGWLDVKAGDYVWVPKAMIHRWHVGQAKDAVRAMVFESRGGFKVPDQFRNPVGQLQMDAPYTHRDFVRPIGPIATPDQVPDGPRELFMKRAGKFQRYALERSPMDVVGWDGFVYPMAFAIEKYQAKTGLDEVILYLRGSFTSRRGVGPGAISLHPAGIAHGPHPGAYEASIGSKKTDEMAVMLDTFAPLLPTAQGVNLEDRGYHESWKTG